MFLVRIDLTGVEAEAAPNNGTTGSLYHLLTSPPVILPPNKGSDYITDQFPVSNVTGGQNATTDISTTTAATTLTCDCSQVMLPLQLLHKSNSLPHFVTLLKNTTRQSLIKNVTYYCNRSGVVEQYTVVK